VWTAKRAGLAVTFATEHRLVAVVADAITLQFAGIVQVLLPSLFVMSVPPLVAQSFPSTAMVILRLFDLLTLLAADWPWAVSANAASAITAADTMCESFMMSPVRNQRLVYQNPMHVSPPEAPTPSAGRPSLPADARSRRRARIPPAAGATEARAVVGARGPRRPEHRRIR
jgi:hypothetical protein